ncbi:ferredoxin [Streptomyces rubiginosohelvolus]|uniref:ferredoxin n=1 Tax=Streptomyces rubiginosohelvolus TaxID=67362 RepID=UPI0035DD1615
MRVTVDRDRCEGHGLCEDTAPDLFRIDDEGELILRFADVVPPGQEHRADEAVRVCPVGALHTPGAR